MKLLGVFYILAFILIGGSLLRIFLGIGGRHSLPVEPFTDGFAGLALGVALLLGCFVAGRLGRKQSGPVKESGLSGEFRVLLRVFFDDLKDRGLLPFLKIGLLLVILGGLAYFLGEQQLEPIRQKSPNSSPTQGAALQAISEDAIESNLPAGPAALDFFIKRDVGLYLGDKGMPVTVEYEFLRVGPTQSGVSYPKFYLWAKAYDKDKLLLAEGAVRIAAIDGKRIEVTDFIRKEKILSDPSVLGNVFPALLIPAIERKAGL